jgi:cell division transport system permease protein
MRHKIRYFARETVISLRRNLLMTIAGILTVAVSLLLVGGSLMLQKWVDNGTQKWRSGVEFEVFMEVDASETEIQAVEAELAADSEVESVEFFSKDEAYEEFKRLFSDQESLIENTRPEDLPTSFRVVPTDVEHTDDLKTKYGTFAGVGDVQTPDESIDTLLTITKYLRWVFIGLAIVLLSSALFLIMNTIRLATFARRREIEVMKLVGASNWFVRIPFMAEGFVQGALGAGLAIGGVFSMWWLFDQNQSSSPTAFFAGYYVDISTAYRVAAGVLLFGVCIGVVGSLFGVRRFLKV